MWNSKVVKLTKHLHFTKIGPYYIKLRETRHNCVVLQLRCSGDYNIFFYAPFLETILNGNNMQLIESPCIKHIMQKIGICQNSRPGHPEAWAALEPGTSYVYIDSF